MKTLAVKFARWIDSDKSSSYQMMNEIGHKLSVYEWEVKHYLRPRLLKAAMWGWEQSLKQNKKNKV